MNPYHQLQFLWMIISAGSRKNSEEATRAPSSSGHCFWSTVNAGLMGDYFNT